MGMLIHDHIETMMNMERIHNEWIRIHGKDFTAEDVDKVYEASEAGIFIILNDFEEPKPFVLETIDKLRQARKIFHHRLY